MILSYVNAPTGFAFGMVDLYVSTSGRRSSGSAKLNIATPIPISAARCTVPGLVAVTQSGGCGFCTTRGRMQRSGTEKYLPCQEKSSCVHICGMARMASSHMSRVSSLERPNVFTSVLPLPRPGAELDASVRHDVDVGDLLRHANGMIDRRAEVEDAGHDADAFRLHADGQAGEVRRRPVRVFLEAVVLGRPVGVEPRGVGGDPDLDVATDAQRLRHVPRSRADGGALENSELERHGRGVYPGRPVIGHSPAATALRRSFTGGVLADPAVDGDPRIVARARVRVFPSRPEWGYTAHTRIRSDVGTRGHLTPGDPC